MSKSRFRIIALRPITPSLVSNSDLEMVKSIQKKVFGSSWLYFYRGYRLIDENVFSNKEDSESFYGRMLEVDESSNDDSVLYDQNDICISIGAIVGPNGSGKSSTIELMIRILNNFSVAAKGETVNHSAAEHLFFIENVYGCVVLQEGDDFFQIKVAGRSVTVASYNRCVGDNMYICDSPLELLSPEAKNDRLNPIEGSGEGMMHLCNMFYTAIFNYSMYAFNYRDYYNERTIENRWSKAQVHTKEVKNKYFNDPFNENQVWLKGLFHKNDGYQTPIVLNPMRDNGIIDIPRENHLACERLINKLFYANSKMQGYAGQPLFPFRLINDHLEIVALKIRNKENPKFSRKNVLNNLGFRGNALTKDFDNISEKMCKLWSDAFCMAYSKETIHEKLAWDYVIYKTLKIIKTYDKYERFRKDIFYFKDFDEKKVARYFDMILQDESHVTLKLRQALTFLKYRIFRENYSDIVILKDAYFEYLKVHDTFKQMNLRMDKESKELIGDIPLGYAAEDMPRLSIKDSQLNVSMPKSDIHPIPLFFVDRGGNLKFKLPDYDEAILPPIFDIEPMLIERTSINEDGTFDDHDLIPMSGLSSGEKQIAGSISNMVYHLANINSVWQDNNEIKLGQYKSLKKEENVQELPLLKYKYVNIVFDEVELYFHPDLQRRFVRNILDALKNVHLENIEGINIMLVTHSPFVLSDLPRTNVLALNNEQSDIEETFCANIHELLGSSFFMTYSMGELAREQVETIFMVYKKFKNRDEKFIEDVRNNWEKFKYIASKIADEYLCKIVNSMLEEMSSEIIPEDELDRQIHEAKCKLKELLAKKESML